MIFRGPRNQLRGPRTDKGGTPAYPSADAKRLNRGHVNLGQSAALLAHKCAARPKSKIGLQKNYFRRFQPANAVSRKDVAPLVTLARSAPGSYRDAHSRRESCASRAL